MASKGTAHGLDLAREKMRQAGVDEVAIDTFAHYYRLLEHGETGMIAEDTIEPLDMESLTDVDVTTAAFSMLGMVLWLSRWYNPDGRLTPEQVAEEITKIALGGLLRPPPRSIRNQKPEARSQ